MYFFFSAIVSMKDIHSLYLGKMCQVVYNLQAFSGQIDMLYTSCYPIPKDVVFAFQERVDIFGQLPGYLQVAHLFQLRYILVI